jgi:hypothetical protein
VLSDDVLNLRSFIIMLTPVNLRNRSHAAKEKVKLRVTQPSS